jgi:SAM-dependent methyltransferase
MDSSLLPIPFDGLPERGWSDSPYAWWLLAWTGLVFLAWCLTPRSSEAFSSSSPSFEHKTHAELYDAFYADLYDSLTFNELRCDAEVQAVLHSSPPSGPRSIVDVGCGTGHVVARLTKLLPDATVVGLDRSPDMIAKARDTHPSATFRCVDVEHTPHWLPPHSCTDVTCLYFTACSLTRPRTFLQDVFRGLTPGGHLILHTVDPDQFDPILPPGNPLLLVSPQRYAKERIRTTHVVFENGMKYDAVLDLPSPSDPQHMLFRETFRHTRPAKVRKQEHRLRIRSPDEWARDCEWAGFVWEQTIDLVACQYEYQYLTVWTKPV